MDLLYEMLVLETGLVEVGVGGVQLSLEAVDLTVLRLDLVLQESLAFEHVVQVFPADLDSLGASYVLGVDPNQGRLAGDAVLDEYSMSRHAADLFSVREVDADMCVFRLCKVSRLLVLDAVLGWENAFEVVKDRVGSRRS